MVLTVKPGPTRTTIYRSDFATFHRERLSDFVYSGFTCSDGGGLNLAVAAGAAYISGWRIAHSEASTVLLTDNKTNKAWLDKDGTFKAQDSQPSESIQVAEAVTSGGVITSIIDKRSTTVAPESKVLIVDTGGHDHSGAGNKGTKVAHGNILSVTADQHHAGLVGLKDNAGTVIDPDAGDRIQVTDDGKVNADLVGGNLSLSIVQAQLDHGSIGGLADDDHAQYFNDSRHQENHRLRKAQAVPTPGVNDVYGTAVQVGPSTGSDSLYPKGVKLTWGGTFGTETVTIRVTFQFSDATSLNVEKSRTAVGSEWLSDDEFLGIWKDAVRVTRIDVDSKTSIASTTVTTTVDVIGDQN